MTALFRTVLSFLLITLVACATSKPSAGSGSAPAPGTVVYVVRHAEKSTDPPADPLLTPAGEQRALALRDSLQGPSFAAVYATNTQRTRATGAPLATANKLEITSYEGAPTGLATLATQIRELGRGKAALVVGHSNTVLETIEALGAPRPVPRLTDADYNYLFEVTLPADGSPATVRTRRYGEGPR